MSTQKPYSPISQKLYYPVVLLLFTVQLFGQDKDSVRVYPDGTTGLLLEVRPSDYLKRKLQPNEFEGTYSTIRIGFGYIGDAATYSQSSVFKKQMDSAGLEFKSAIETRDARILASGVFKTKRSLSWKIGMMYDGDKKVWLLRETGLNHWSA